MFVNYGIIVIYQPNTSSNCIWHRTVLPQPGRGRAGGVGIMRTAIDERDLSIASEAYITDYERYFLFLS